MDFSDNPKAQKGSAMRELAMDSNANKKLILLVRLVHGGISAFFLTCIAYLYYAGLTDTMGLWSNLALAALIAEGVVVWMNKGNCPLGALHHKVGDDKTFFELFVPRPVAQKGIPFFALVTLIGLVVYVL